MKYLLDTSVFLWALAAPEKLNRRARQLLTTEKEGLFLSVASSWEISVKFGLGKLELPEAPAKCIPMWMSNWRIQGLDITHRHTLSVSDLPSHHQDPFDRILIAQAMNEEMVLVTADHAFEKYDVRTLWCGS